MDNSNQPGSTPERPAGETPPNPEGAPSTGQPTERVTPYGAEPTPTVDPSQLTMPQPQTTIYTPQPNVPGPGPAPQPQQPYTGEAARAPQQPPGQYQQPGQQPGQQQGYPQQPYAQGQYPPQGQYQQPGQQPGYPPQGQYPQQYPPQYQQQGYPPPGYGQPVQPAPKKGGVPTIVWVLGGSLLVVLLICGGIAFFTAQAINRATEGMGDIVGTIEAGVGGIPSWEFYNALNSGDYDLARTKLSADLKREYPASRLQEEWETLVDAAGGISVGPYNLSGPASNGTWVQELTGDGNNKLYTINVKVNTVGSDYLITGATPSLIPEP